MARYALLFGTLLIALGLVGYFAPGTFGEYKEVSKTSLIPAYFGVALFLCGVLVVAKPGLRKHVMHFAALIGLLGFAGGFMPMKSKNFDFNMASAVSGAIMSGLSLIFVILCVKSFIDARKARTNAAA